MFIKLPRKLVIGLIFVFAILNVWLWYFLAFNPPHNVIATDITHNEAVVVWNSRKPTLSTVYFSSHPFLLKLLPLTIPFVEMRRNNIKTTNHRIVLSSLEASSTYSIAISDNLHFYKVNSVSLFNLDNKIINKINGLELPKIKTDSTSPSGLLTIRGMTVPNYLVVARTTSGKYFSGITDVKGNFYLNIDPKTIEKTLFITVYNRINQQRTVVIPQKLFSQPILIDLK